MTIPPVRFNWLPIARKHFIGKKVATLHARLHVKLTDDADYKSLSMIPSFPHVIHLCNCRIDVSNRCAPMDQYLEGAVYSN